MEGGEMPKGTQSRVEREREKARRREEREAMAHGKMDGEMEALSRALELRRLEAV